ncbi:MAG: N-acetylmuramoyl-L-alanine amidase [Elusimicrobiaceae bacterium]|nr:N-acetylmuramoyl-L-alanine amidase [Elusimicrobiaceae bacterium]
MKRLISVAVSFMCVLAGLAGPAPARTVRDKIQFAVAGKYAGSVDTLEIDGNLHVQAKTVCQLLKGTVYWNARSGGLSCRIKRVAAVFKTGSREVRVDGRDYEMSSALRVSDGIPYLPIDFITGDTFGPAIEREISYNETAHSLDVEKPYNVSQVDYFSYGTSMRLSFDLKGVEKFSAVEKGPRHVQIVIADALAQLEEKVRLNDEFVQSVAVSGSNGNVQIDIYLSENDDVWKAGREQDTLVIEVSKKTGDEREEDAGGRTEATVRGISDSGEDYGVAVVSEDTLQIPDIISPDRAGRRRIVIDPGHGGKDPGGRKRYGLPEKSLNLRVAKELAQLLADDGGYDILVTRTSDYYISLPQRCDMANEFKADLFVSLHANANSNRREKGFEVYFMSENASDPLAAAVAAKENSVLRPDEKMPLEDPAEMLLHSMARNEYMNEGARLSGMIVKRLGIRTPLKNRGVKQAAFYVLRGTYAPAVLVETGFMSNADDCKQLNNPKVIKKIARGIYEGIDDYAKANGWK